ncbi:hypothetical protein ACA910_001846 [Epithemia clementina (nom. ined.)]
MKLASPEDHPHGLSNAAFDSIFTKDKPVLFNFHAYPQLVEKLVFDRTNRRFKVKGYHEEGTISTAFDMCVTNGVDRFSLVIDCCDMIENDCGPCVDRETCWTAAYVRQDMTDKLVEHKRFINEYGVDMPEVQNWRWKASNGAKK